MDRKVNAKKCLYSEECQMKRLSLSQNACFLKPFLLLLSGMFSLNLGIPVKASNIIFISSTFPANSVVKFSIIICF